MLIVPAVGFGFPPPSSSLPPPVKQDRQQSTYIKQGEERLKEETGGS
jgi:hypothetical protein